MHFADRLLDACRRKHNVLCVGIDPPWDQLPLTLRVRHAGGTLEAMASAFEDFSVRVLVVPRLCPSSSRRALLRSVGPAGMLAQQRVLAKARCSA